VCDLETSRIGAPYIYDISNLRFNEFRFCGFVKVLILAHCSSDTDDTATKFKCIRSDKCVFKAAGFNFLLLTATCYVGNENFGFIM
jgi:hypothetical protein